MLKNCIMMYIMESFIVIINIIYHIHIGKPCNRHVAMTCIVVSIPQTAINDFQLTHLQDSYVKDISFCY